ncbi:hypothetical protein EBZ37_07470, partial [bacterium]|nr:hypothetical protein [bacterium]
MEHGIMVTGDITAISIAILSIAFCEISSIVMNTVLRHEFDHLQNRFIADNQRSFIDRWASGEIQPDKKEAHRFWFSDLGRVANLLIRQRWMRVRDITLVIILGSVAIAISTVSGLFLVGFIAVHIMAGIFLNNRWGLAHYAARSLHEKEEELTYLKLLRKADVLLRQINRCEKLAVQFDDDVIQDSSRCLFGPISDGFKFVMRGGPPLKPEVDEARKKLDMYSKELEELSKKLKTEFHVSESADAVRKKSKEFFTATEEKRKVDEMGNNILRILELLEGV